MTDQDPEGPTPGPIDALAERATPDQDPKHRGRTGLACGVTLVLLSAALALGGLLVRSWWTARQPADPADYAGSGSGSVRIDVPQGANLTEIGRLLLRGGVVASVQAFTREAAGDPAAARVQPGDYAMHRRMSARSALLILTDPANAGGLVIPEGRRATQVYAAIDDRLALKAGTTAAAARRGAAALGLPAYAARRPEGFLFPARYSVTKGTQVLELLRRMVAQAKTEYAADNIGTGSGAYRTVTIASLIQAEAQQPGDFAKVARVIRNRLDRNMPLQLDSALNYALGRTTVDTSHADITIETPYNTYLHPGLPPTPVCNPGHAAIRAALRPATGDWLYFVTVKPGDTRFTDSYEQHQRNVAEFNRYRQQHSSSPAPSGR